jgi:hypothetical protein
MQCCFCRTSGGPATEGLSSHAAAAPLPLNNHERRYFHDERELLILINFACRRRVRSSWHSTSRCDYRQQRRHCHPLASSAAALTFAAGISFGHRQPWSQDCGGDHVARHSNASARRLAPSLTVKYEF